MLAPEGYGLLSATRVLLERCARAKLLEIYANVCYQTPCKVEDVLFNAENRTVHGEPIRMYWLYWQIWKPMQVWHACTQHLQVS